jgi:hypothetical protein
MKIDDLIEAGYKHTLRQKKEYWDMTHNSNEKNPFEDELSALEKKDKVSPENEEAIRIAFESYGALNVCNTFGRAIGDAWIGMQNGLAYKPFLDRCKARLKHLHTDKSERMVGLMDYFYICLKPIFLDFVSNTNEYKKICGFGDEVENNLDYGSMVIPIYIISKMFPIESKKAWDSLEVVEIKKMMRDECMRLMEDVKNLKVKIKEFKKQKVMRKSKKR